MGCSRWDEIEFVKFCQNKLSQRELTELHGHLDACKICRDMFISAWNALMAEQTSSSDEAQIEQILASPRWQARRQQMSRLHAETIKRQLAAGRKTARLKQHTRNWVPIAAMLLAVLMPLGIFYIYYQHQRKTVIDLTQFTNVSSNDSMALASAFENISRLIETHPDNSELYFNRAQILEKLYLLEAAQRDYQKYLSMSDISQSEPARKKLAQLTEQLTNPLQPAPTRYELLDQYINDYLAAMSRRDQPNADKAAQDMRAMANEMAAWTDEQIGNDLYSYYLNVSAEDAGTLLKARILRAKYERFGSGDTYSAALKDLSEVKETFTKLQANCEVRLSDLQLARFLIRSGDHKNAQKLIEKHFEETVKDKHRFIQTNLLLRIGELKAELSQFDESRTAIKESLKMAESLNVPAFCIEPSILLTAVYFVSNKDQSAFDYGFKALTACDKSRQEISKIRITQLLGISSFNLQYPKLSEYFLSTSISLSKRHNKLSYAAISYAFLGITHTEQQLYKQSQDDFNNAITFLKQMNDEKARDAAASTVYGYQARASVLAGDLERAKDQYEKTLELSKKINLSQKLFLSQLHQGLGECLARLGEKDRAESELRIAVDYAREARVGSEENNTLLTFAVTRVEPEAILQRLIE